MLFDRFSSFSHLFAKGVQWMKCQLYRFAYFRFLCCHFLVRLRLKNKKYRTYIKRNKRLFLNLWTDCPIRICRNQSHQCQYIQVNWNTVFPQWYTRYTRVDKDNERMSIYYSCTEFHIWRCFLASERASVSQCVVLPE